MFGEKRTQKLSPVLIKDQHGLFYFFSRSLLSTTMTSILIQYGGRMQNSKKGLIFPYVLHCTQYKYLRTVINGNSICWIWSLVRTWKSHLCHGLKRQLFLLFSVYLVVVNGFLTLMRDGPDCEYENRKKSLVICDTDIPYRLTK